MAATQDTIGISSTMPTSKKSGSPMMAAISAIAQGMRRGPDPGEDRVDDLVGAAGVGEQLAEYRAERDQHADAAERRPRPRR